MNHKKLKININIKENQLDENKIKTDMEQVKIEVNLSEQ